MGKVVIHATVSLDGFITGPHDELDWVFKYGSDKMADDVVKDTGAVVLGKRTYEISIKNNQLPYGHRESAPVCVYS
jgi:dihydrofolate reductase